MPYCPRCGTALSSHEVALGYKDVVDPSVYVRFPCATRRGVAARLDHHAVDAALERGAGRQPGRDYVRARVGDEVLIVAEALVERVLGEGAEVEARMKGAELAGTAYEPPFPYVTDYGARGQTVLEADFVTTDDGTGIVHTALAFGEDDFRLGERYGLTSRTR